MPLWWGHVNKRVFNRFGLRNPKWQVVEHVGRSSGRTYRTPVEAVAVDGGFLVVLVYGSRSDWVRNVMAAGGATLEVGGARIAVTDPTIVGPDEAFSMLPAGTKRPPRLLRIDEFLVLHRVEAAAPG